MTSPSRSAVVLLQLGGPDGPDAVEPFLYNLFCDPDIIDLPLAFLFRKPLARLISSRRAPRIREHYRRIGGQSPIARLTQRQAGALERRLAGTCGARVRVAMRYWHPFTEQVIADLRQKDVDRVVLLPLYPQYSKSTTGSGINEWNRVAARLHYAPHLTVVEEYCEHPLYIRAIVGHIRIALRRIPPAWRGDVHLVFTAHGTPLKLVRQGDPYREQVERTRNAVVKAGAFGLPHTLCYQSKVGPQKWLEPSLPATIRELAGRGASHVVVVPLAFVSDHIETLHEINMEVRDEARRLGIRHFDITPALHTDPSFIDALAELVEQHLR